MEMNTPCGLIAMHENNGECFDPDITRKLRIILVITALLLIVGLVSPIITLNKFVVFENTFSVFSGVMQLLMEGQYFLFIIIACFSIVLPILKLAIMFKILSPTANFSQLKKYLSWMHHYGKWSMLDVFVVAILVVSVKLGVIASVEMRFGLYSFAASVILMMYVTARVVQLTDDKESS